MHIHALKLAYHPTNYNGNRKWNSISVTNVEIKKSKYKCKMVVLNGNWLTGSRLENPKPVRKLRNR